MSKRLANMTRLELFDELAAWGAVLDEPKGPGSPSNAARASAERFYADTEAWIARNEIEMRLKP